MRRTTKASINPRFDPRDLAAARQLSETLEAVADLPYQARWAMAMELLPDSFLNYVAGVRDRQKDTSLKLYTLLSMVVLEEWAGIEEVSEREKLIMIATYGVLTSLYAELERRHRHFSDSVTHMTDPMDPENPVQYHLRDPETFSHDALAKHYQALCAGLLTEEKG
jgi:hypothetical protein